MLEGNLDEFSITDIFQLLSLTKKSGALRVSGEEAEGRVYFKAGEVYFAVADTCRMSLSARLVGAGLVSEEQLSRVLEEGQGGGSVRLGQLLLEEDSIDEAALDSLVREQIQDAVFELMRHRKGSFKFDPAEDADGAVGLSLSTEHLLMEGSRRLAEWQVILERIPSRNAVLAIVPTPSAADGHVAVTLEQWRLLALVDGQRTVRDIVDLTGQGEFATCQVLSELIDTGYVEAYEPGNGHEPALSALLRRRDALRRLEELEAGTATRAPAASAPPAAAPPAAAPPAAAPAPPAPAAPAPAPVAGAAAAPATAPRPVAVVREPGVDRADLARELASLGGNQASPTRPIAKPSAAPGGRHEEYRALTRDEDVNKGLLLRLIDGVKGA